jgi:hypothetical protein
MNTTPKTDECIKMLGEARFIFSHLNYNGKGYFDKDLIIDFQNRIKAMLNYRLMPLVVISIPDNADKDTAMAHPMLQHISNFNAFWYAMKNYQLITADDLRNEFWSICPDLESIPKFLDVMNVKFKEVNYRYDTDINTIKDQYNGLNEHVKAEIISEQEADEMFWNIDIIADRYNFIMCRIREIYSTFRKMVKPLQADTVQPQQQPHFTRQFTPDEQKKLYEGLKNGCFLPQETICSHFYHVFGGTAIPDNETPFKPLVWQKSVGLLAYCIDNLFSDTDGTNLWETTINCFLWKGNKPNKDTMKNTVSKYKQDYKEKPKGYEEIDTIIRF